MNCNNKQSSHEDFSNDDGVGSQIEIDNSF